MSAKPVIVTPPAEREIRQITAWYRNEGGGALALQWAAAVESALRHIGRHPAIGSMRYATLLQLAGLRFWPVKGFPLLIFYVERKVQIDVWRVLHAQRDIPAWMRESG